MLKKPIEQIKAQELVVKISLFLSAVLRKTFIHYRKMRTGFVFLFLIIQLTAGAQDLDSVELNENWQLSPVTVMIPVRRQKAAISY